MKSLTHFFPQLDNVWTTLAAAEAVFNERRHCQLLASSFSPVASSASDSMLFVSASSESDRAEAHSIKEHCAESTPSKPMAACPAVTRTVVLDSLEQESSLSRSSLPETLSSTEIHRPRNW